ncbi:hypothetical protein E0F76_07470 [Flavobacterium cellulosilyticum]|uniref:DUF4175 domain-containing protein n=2 Tax=Flavobacterium cellulosilyticum TaxID=2541731 RepID=A0A4R5CFX1_9FLAO|nr:hypothetical protein E0F76_07470 [Flavobacterium cellulosilyticum]
MKKIVKTLLIIITLGSMISCKSTFNASETMGIQGNRSAVYQEIISNPNQFKEFIDLANKDEEANKIMMHSHMQMMESGNMKKMMEKDPEMKQKMKTHMAKMMEENSEMKEKMQTKMLDKMMESSEGRMMLMHKMHENKDMQGEMMENPAMMEMMMEKMQKNPDMMKMMMEKIQDKDMKDKKHSDHK